MGLRRAALSAIAAGGALAGMAAAQQPAPAVTPDRSLVPYADTRGSVRLPDGRMLHLVCMGQGSPTVILTAGAGAMPLIVLTRTEFQPPLDYPPAARAEIPAEEAAWNQGHDELAALSTRGVNARVPGAAHFIHAAKPQVVIDAIEQVVREARENGEDGNAR